MANSTLEMQGMDTLVGVIQNARANATPQMAKAAMKVMNGVFVESQRQCPVRTGTLKGSGELHPPDLAEGIVEITISYGGAAAGYAAWVHENMAAHHRPPTKAKFLEDPMSAVAGKLDAIAGEGGMEEAILKQYPQSPALGHKAEMAAETNAGYRGMSTARRKAAVARSSNIVDIAGALKLAGQRRGRMIRGM